MRAVTFADPVVVHYLKNHFVLLWHDQAPQVAAEPTHVAPEEASAYDEGSGGGNMRTYICAADGKVCYYLEGYWGPERYLARMRLGHELTMKLAAARGEDRQRLAGRELSQHLWDLAAERRRLRDQRPQDLARKSSTAARDDAQLRLLQNAVRSSADLHGQVVTPILAELEEKNRVLVST